MLYDVLTVDLLPVDAEVTDVLTTLMRRMANVGGVANVSDTFSSVSILSDPLSWGAAVCTSAKLAVTYWFLPYFSLHI